MSDKEFDLVAFVLGSLVIGFGVLFVLAVIAVLWGLPGPFKLFVYVGIVCAVLSWWSVETGSRRTPEERTEEFWSTWLQGYLLFGMPVIAVLGIIIYW
jgi:hypothetical protein